MNSLGVRRALLRTDVTLAARILPVHYPLQAFIAVNPLGGLLDQPFAQALTTGSDLFGAPGTMPEPWFRTAHGTGRITDSDLAAALHDQHPTLLAATPLTLGSHRVDSWQLLRADLLHGTPDRNAQRRCQTRAEVAAPAVAQTVDDLTGKWCSAYLGRAPWSMPGREEGLYPAWRTLGRYDRSLPRPVRAQLVDLPERADDALLHALDVLAVSEDTRVDWLRADLTRLPGWAAHVRWHNDHPEQSPQDDSRAALSLVDYLAMRLSCEALLLHAQVLPLPGHHPTPGTDLPSPATPDGIAAEAAAIRAATALGALGVHDSQPEELTMAAALLEQLPVSSRTQVWLGAYEGHYRDSLLTQLSDSHAPTPAPVGRARAQVVCCIDARSEGLRRQLEALHPQQAYDTLGFAGFFAVAIRYTSLANGAPTDLCPVLLSPSTMISEVPAPGYVDEAARQVAGLQVLAGGAGAFHAAKDDLLSPFTLAEAGGLLAGPLAAAKTAAPGLFGALRRRLHQQAAPPAPTALTDADAFPLPERVLYAQVALTTMGLTHSFARMVLLCGHGSTTENNPYQAALDCGACGGHRGAPNARTAAAILNDPAVRAELSALAIAIPSDTVFAAAEHDTATDQITVLDLHFIPSSHRPDVDLLSHDLTTAGELLAAERAADLPGTPARARRTPSKAHAHVAGRATDWAQVYPEWGLASNAAFLIGPRSLSRGRDLGRRVFLHSYDPDVDPDGTALETILTAPLVVAQWINAQYYFSTVAPHVFGAGSKTIHNVIRGLGVLAGHTGDLQLGLPWQSVGYGEHLAHEPMRLLTAVQAPLDRIETIIDRNPILQQLFGNQWLTLTARADQAAPWQSYGNPGWRPWNAATPGSSSTSEASVPSTTSERTS